MKLSWGQLLLLAEGLAASRGPGGGGLTNASRDSMPTHDAALGGTEPVLQDECMLMSVSFPRGRPKLWCVLPDAGTCVCVQLKQVQRTTCGA